MQGLVYGATLNLLGLHLLRNPGVTPGGKVMDTRINFTKLVLDKLPLPEEGQRTVYHDDGGLESVHGLQLRVTASGVKTFGVFRRVAGGKPERVSLGRFPDMSVEQARKLAKKMIAQLAEGKSPNAEKQAKRGLSLTLADALAEYVRDKRRTKDGLPLKERTKADYLAKVAPGKVKADGTQRAAGELFKLANKPIHQITASDVWMVHKANLKRGERSAAYAMQVLRAVMSWHGVVIPNSPFSKDTHGKDRIQIPQAHASGRSIPPESIGPWWNAANALPASAAVDYLKFCLLTGCRPAEPLKVLVGDCDLVGGRVLLHDTKNRKDHTLALSRQALKIVERQAAGKASVDRLFGLYDAKKTVQALVKATGIEFAPKVLRASFASIAEVLVSAYCLKRMMNHAQSGDVTGTHYVQKGEAELREGWQAVADWIERQARAAQADNVVPIRGGAA